MIEAAAGEGARLPAAIVAEAFRRALAAAEAFEGNTAPNPPVGCVALDAGGAILACEAHRGAGRAHAEAAAIEACARAGVLARLHTLVVTLEPCNHVGRTPPCVDAVLTTPARAAWIGARDPNPRVAGGGAARLAAAGLDVRFADALTDPAAGDLARASRRLIAPFGLWSRSGRPWITVKQALTPAGSMIPPPGTTTFTSPESLDLAHRLRRRADAILTGSGCVLADSPAFTVRRVVDHPGNRRILAILDRRGRVPASYVTAAQARGFDVRLRTDLDGLVRELGAADVLEVLVEAGPTLHASLMDEGLWDEHVTIRQQVGGPDLVTSRLREPI
jgi:diaminohydroxyphosphoribosylaminopyrimidine deaminase/5-amino-6-(5-phosphoribosylamino)uracil reductase